MTQYPVPDEFFSKTSKHCIALFIQHSEVGTQPKESDLNATLTLIEYQGKTYGITCKHVVELLKDKETKDKIPYNFATLARCKYILLDNFIFPPNDLFAKESPDIAIRQIHPDFPRAIGKIPIPIEQQMVPALQDIRHAIAVGFPTSEKKRVNTPNGYCIEMPCVHALAKVNRITDNQLSLHSELDKPTTIRDFNGMSGGPVFWATEDDYGLLGIMCQALKPQPSSDTPSDNSFGGGPRIIIKAERVTLDRFRSWLSQDNKLTEKVNWI